MRARLRRSDILVPLGDRRFAALLVNAPTPAAMAVARGVHAAVEETAVAGAAVGVCAFDASATAARIMAEAESALLRARRTNGVAASGAA
jgi:GGDEF domain-containing protein